MVYTHTWWNTAAAAAKSMEYYSAIKKNKTLPRAATWMNLKGIKLSEMSDREEQILYDITYGT